MLPALTHHLLVNQLEYNNSNEPPLGGTKGYNQPQDKLQSGSDLGNGRSQQMICRVQLYLLWQEIREALGYLAGQ